jgi:hypothetical protein
MNCTITYKVYDEELARTVKRDFGLPTFAHHRDSRALCQYDTIEELFDALISIEKSGGGMPTTKIGKYTICADTSGGGRSRIYVFGGKNE